MNPGSLLTLKSWRSNLIPSRYWKNHFWRASKSWTGNWEYITVLIAFVVAQQQWLLSSRFVDFDFPFWLYNSEDALGSIVFDQGLPTLLRLWNVIHNDSSYASWGMIDWSLAQYFHMNRVKTLLSEMLVILELCSEQERKTIHWFLFSWLWISNQIYQVSL